MRILCGIAGTLGFAALAGAQVDERLADRHTRIAQLYEEQQYAQLVREIDLQIKESAGTTFADSLHRYLYKYGRAHRKLKDAAAGTEAAERIYALVKARRNANNELEALFDLSWTYYDVGEMKQCARVDSMAVSVADSDAKVSLGQKGRARQYLAFDHSIIGDHRRSAYWAQSALDTYAKADSISAMQWAESYTALGVAYWHLGRIREAEQQYAKALDVLGSATDEASLNRKVSTYGNLGVLWQNAGDLVRAKTYYHESLRHSDRLIAATEDQFTRDEAMVNRSRTYLNLATVYTGTGDDARAQELLELAWKDRNSVLEPDDPQLLAVRERIADLELARGSLDKAQELLESYVHACEQKFGNHSEEYLRSTSKLGEVLFRKGEWLPADSLFRLCVAIGGSKPDAATDVVLASTLQKRSRLAMQQGRHADAEADLLKARSVMVRTYDSAHYKVAGVDVLLAEAATAAGDHDAALKASTSALRILADRVASMRASRAPKAYPDPHLVPDAIYGKVRSQRSLHGGGAPDPQWSMDLDLAITALARNKSVVQDDASKLLIVGAQGRLFDLALEIAYDGFAATGSEQDLGRFLQVLEADRSTLLKARLNAFAGLRYAGIPDTLIAREQEMIAGLVIDPDMRTSATDLEQKEKAYAELIASLERDYPKYFDLRYGEPVIGLKDVRERLLTDDRQMLAYAFAGDHLYMLVIGEQQANIFRTEAQGIEDLVRDLNAAIADRSMQKYLEVASTLYQRVVAPAAVALNAGELLVIPDGILHTINFETLLSKPSTSKDFRSNLLVERYTIAYLLSATTAVQFAGLAHERTKGALALAPGFDDDLKQRYLAAVSDSSRIDRRFLSYVRQPFAVNTAQDLAGVLSAKVMVGAEADEPGFRDQARNFGILHLGTHAEMNASAPMYSRLVLSRNGGEVEADADGYLHAYEIYELDLRAQLAVLTACETGTGSNDGEGVRSLGYGFAYAGCPSLVMSLWNIDEQVSSAIIKRFYELLADGLPKHVALRQAKLDHLATATDELAQPFYWAGLVLVGDVEPIDMDRAWPWRTIVLVVVVLLIAVLLFRRWRKGLNAASPGHS
jgi:CHAT domain-containing protein